MKPDSFAERVSFRVDAAEHDLRVQVRNLLAEHAAKCALESGATVTRTVGIARVVLISFTSQVLNDYEHARRTSRHDPALWSLVSAAPIQFRLRAAEVCELKNLRLGPSASAAGKKLLDQAGREADEMLKRYREGLPVEGVTRRDDPGSDTPTPVWRGLERFAQANAALSNLISFAAGAVVALAAAMLSR